MSSAVLLIMLILLSGAAAFLFIWRRRDKGVVPEDGLPDALHEMFTRRPKS